LKNVLRIGLISLAGSAACFLLLALLGELGVVKAGPCGFDAFGWVLFFGISIGIVLGGPLTAAGLLREIFIRIHT